MNGQSHPSDPLCLDGNAAAGTLSEIFAVDLTAAAATCAGCGATDFVGALLVYDQGMGTVIRCKSCEGIVMRLVRTPGHVYLDASGARRLVIDVS